MSAELAAGIILGTSFKTDAGTRDAVIRGAQYQRSGAVVALCLGWPQHEMIWSLYKGVSDPGDTQLLLPAIMHLYRVSVDADNFVWVALRCLNQVRGDIWEFLPEVAEAITRRIIEDDDVHSQFAQYLAGEITPTERASLPRLLAAARGVGPELHQWCEREIDRQQAAYALSQVGFDIAHGRFRPVIHSLLDVLLPYGLN